MKKEIPIELIDDNPHEPRIATDDIMPLVKSISKVGLMVAIIVIKVEKRYVLVAGAGHRRVRAFKRLGRKTILADIRKESTKKDMERDLAMENQMENQMECKFQTKWNINKV